MTNIRTFQNSDMQSLIALWNYTKQEPFMDERFFLKCILLDMNFDENGFFIAERQGKIVGCCQAVVRHYPVDVGAPSEENRGYINMFACLNPDDWLGEVGQSLVRHAENHVRSQGKKEIHIATYSPNYVHPGVNVRNKTALSLFKSLGYTQTYETRSIKNDLTAFTPIASIETLQKERENEGFVFTSLKDEYVLPLLRCDLPAGWRHRFRRLLNETLDYDKFHLILHDEKIIGIAVFGDPYCEEGRFGPFRVDEQYQGKGLGKILLYNTLTAMKKAGVRYAWAQSTPCLGAAACVYEKLGFVEIDRFVAMVKELP